MNARTTHAIGLLLFLCGVSTTVAGLLQEPSLAQAEQPASGEHTASSRVSRMLKRREARKQHRMRSIRKTRVHMNVHTHAHSHTTIAAMAKKTGTIATQQRVQHTAPIPAVEQKDLLPVFDQKDILPNHKQIANEVLRSFPKRCQNTLKNFYVRYNNPRQRGLAGKTTMILTGNVSDQEFRALFIHEIGHVFDLNDDPNCLGGTRISGLSEFRDGSSPMYNNDPSVEFYRISWINEHKQRPGMQPSDFVTGYAASDPFEDFAESMAYFVLQNTAFATRAESNDMIRAKYEWFRTHLFREETDLAVGQHTWTGMVRWDATKLPYIWK